MEKKYNWKPLEVSNIYWIGVDWDNCLVDNTGFPDFIPTKPLPGAIEAVKKLDKLGYKIIIYTARPWSDYQNIENYCLEYGIPARRIVCGKPLFKCIIDDKNVAFNGDWEKAFNDCQLI